jgi:O-antigen ligase
MTSNGTRNRRTAPRPHWSDVAILPRRLERLAWVLVVAAVIAVPLTIDPFASNSFRAPKTLLLRAVGLTLIAVGLLWALVVKRPAAPRRRLPADLLLAGGIVGWVTVSMAFSTNYYSSLNAWITVVCCGAYYVATRLLGASKPFSVAYALVIAPVVNAMIFALQRTGLWNPFAQMGRRAGLAEDIVDALSRSALVGNLNDVASSLVLGTIAAAAAAVTDKRTRWRIAAAVAWLICVAGIIATTNRGAMAAAAAGLLVMSFRLKARHAMVIVATVAVLAAIAARFYPPLQLQIRVGRYYLEENRWNSLLSGRLVAFVAAADMARSRPVVGVGPAAFAPNYFDYKICAEAKHAALLTDGDNRLAPNYGQVHNDHLQMIAEIGVPGFVLALAAFVLLALRSRRTGEGESPQRAFIELSAGAVAAALAINALVHFPLQLAATVTGYLYFAGLAFAWSDHVEA